MKKDFSSERHKELFEKFEENKREYIMILGGASEEKAKQFDRDYYKISIKKKIKDYNEKDELHQELILQYMEGENIYQKIDYNKRPIYCRVIDNIINTNLPSKRAHEDDDVYCALFDLSNRIEGIFRKQFKPYSDFSKKKKDKETRMIEDTEKYEMELNSKRGFIDELLDFFIQRGKGKHTHNITDWGKSTFMTPLRYNFLLENLVKSPIKERRNFEREFIKEIPTFAHEGFYFWPEEEAVLVK